MRPVCWMAGGRTRDIITKVASRQNGVTKTSTPSDAYVKSWTKIALLDSRVMVLLSFSRDHIYRSREMADWSGGSISPLGSWNTSPFASSESKCLSAKREERRE